MSVVTESFPDARPAEMSEPRLDNGTGAATQLLDLQWIDVDPSDRVTAIGQTRRGHSTHVP